MNHQELHFSFKARYYRLGEPSDARKIWFVLHGYGQLAQFFIKKFQPVADAGHCVIAPEGLSRFYLKESAGRVGATWMTKENRLMDIENYIEYLNAIYAHELKGISAPDVTILGFSQGAATASRWAVSGISFRRLILWAGLFPPDIDFNKGRDILSQKEVFEVYGDRDPFLTDEKYAEMIRLNDQLQIDVKQVRFNGEHEIDGDALRQFL